MHVIKSQRGITFWGLSFVLGVLAFVVLLIFTLFPPYMEDYKVTVALDALSRQPEFPTMTREEIVKALDRRFDIDMVTTVDPAKHLFIESRGRGAKVVRITYEVVTPLVYNVSLLLDFNHVKEVHGGSE